MRLLRRKSNWDRLKDITAEAISSGDFRRVAKVTLSVAGGAVVATAASAAISAIRRQDEA